MEYTKGEVTREEVNNQLICLKELRDKAYYYIAEVWQGEYMPDAEYEANANRIVDCWNGCQGIENPMAVKDVVEALELLLYPIKGYNRMLKHKSLDSIIEKAQQALSNLKGGKE